PPAPARRSAVGGTGVHDAIVIGVTPGTSHGRLMLRATTSCGGANPTRTILRPSSHARKDERLPGDERSRLDPVAHRDRVDPRSGVLAGGDPLGDGPHG